MTTELSSDPAELKQPPRPRMPPADLRVRLKTSGWLRYLLPTPLVVARAEQKGRALWEQSTNERANAIATMERILAGTPRAHETEELARRYLIERQVWQALFWQPWAMPALDEPSKQRLREAHSSDRGALLSACHTGPHYLAVRPLTARGIVTYAVAGMWFFDEPTAGDWGRRLAHWRKRTSSRLVPASGSFPLLQAVLEQGEILYVCFDMPGPRSTQLLGKPMMLADGTARLAMLTDAPIYLVRSRRHGPRTHFDIAAPLDPRNFAGVGELQDALAAEHERWILELPEQMEDPSSFGWGEWATPAQWIRPPKPANRPA
jgi:lauroyl/myristoyl acyltransferase